MVAQMVKRLIARNAGDPGSIPGSGRSPGEENGNPLQWIGLEFHGQRSLVGYSPSGGKESDTTEWLHFPFFLSLFHPYFPDPDPVSIYEFVFKF